MQYFINSEAYSKYSNKQTLWLFNLQMNST
jgi:hypothetical protein